MEDLVNRFLQIQHIDPVYFVTTLIDVAAIYVWGKLKGGLSVTLRSLYNAIIVVAFVMTAAVVCKVFGVIDDWRELKTIWTSVASIWSNP